MSYVNKIKNLLGKTKITNLIEETTFENLSVTFRLFQVGSIRLNLFWSQL